MKAYITDIIPKIQRFSKRLDDLTKLTNQHWVSLDDIGQAKRVFIFRPNNQLIISVRGIVEKGSWEYLGNQSLLLETKQESYLLKHGFFDDNVIALKLDSSDSYAFFVNESKYDGELNTIEDVLKFLKDNYLNPMANPLGSSQKKVFTETFSYTVRGKKEAFDPVLGSYVVYNIEFMNGTRDKVYRGHSTGRYFYLDNGKVYCENLEDAAYKLFLLRGRRTF